MSEKRNHLSRIELLHENDLLRRKLKVKCDLIKSLKNHIKELEGYLDGRKKI